MKKLFVFPLALILLLPLAFALGATASAAQSVPALNALPDSLPAVIGRLADLTDPIQHIGLPNLSSSMLCVFLVPGYLAARRIPLRERICGGALLLFLIVSLWYPPLDYLWHGMHFPNMLPYRFSFLWSFLLIYMAFRVFMYLDYVKLGSVIAAVAGFLIYLYLAGIYSKDDNIHITTLFKTTEEGQAQIDPVYLSGWIGMILAAWILISLENACAITISSFISAS